MPIYLILYLPTYTHTQETPPYTYPYTHTHTLMLGRAEEMLLKNNGNPAVLTIPQLLACPQPDQLFWGWESVFLM